MHTIDRQRDQLAMAGIDVFPPLDLSWLTDAEPPIAIRSRVALLVPGAAPHRPAKRWPARYFGELAQKLVADGITCLIIGSGADSSLAAEIVGLCPAAQDLTGRTRIQDIASLAARAVCAVGNDTGPMHMAAMVGCPCVVLFSAESDPILTAPRGQVEILRAADLRHLSVEDVVAITDAMMS
jgi:ADP-heptose:LPS heptosyltransferase